MSGKIEYFNDDNGVCEICGATGPMIFVDYGTHGESFCDSCVVKMQDKILTTRFNWQEKAKMVYWRTCSNCGDLDRGSLAKAMETVAKQYVEYLKNLEKKNTG